MSVGEEQMDSVKERRRRAEYHNVETSYFQKNKLMQ